MCAEQAAYRNNQQPPTNCSCALKCLQVFLSAPSCRACGSCHLRRTQHHLEHSPWSQAPLCRCVARHTHTHRVTEGVGQRGCALGLCMCLHIKGLAMQCYGK